MKAAATAASVIAIETLRKRHPRAAVALVVATSGTIAAVVAHNYRPRP